MLLTIDYLIINLKGALKCENSRQSGYTDSEPNPFTLTAHEYGNKTFSEVYDLIYKNVKVGVINAVPRSQIISAELIQLQFENNLFYTWGLNSLSQLVYDFVNYFDVVFEGINRLDIALDNIESDNKYKDLYFEIVSGTKLIKGREKNVGAYSVTKKGVAQFNGFTIGKRSSSRFLRVYNKSEALRLDTTKPYITDWHKTNGLSPDEGQNIWRFEYQLNSTFFTYLRRLGQTITTQIFEIENLIQLIQLAEKNHFEIVENTGKAETNKEKSINLIQWDKVKAKYKAFTGYVITKLKKVFEVSVTIQKRLIKSLFRQYYIEQNLAFLYPLIKILKEYDLFGWFCSKYKFYISEFHNKEKIKNHFNENYFINQLNAFLC